MPSRDDGQTDSPSACCQEEHAIGDDLRGDILALESEEPQHTIEYPHEYLPECLHEGFR